MSKAQWIRDQYALSPEKNIPLFASSLNTQSLVPNPIAQGQIPKPLSFAAIASQLAPNDRRILQNEGAYHSLLANVEKGDLPAIQADLQNLVTTPNISTAAVTVLNNTLAESTQTILDPNWQAQIMASPAELAGFAPVLVDEVVAALEE